MMPENHELIFAKNVLKVRLQKLQTEVTALQTVLSLLSDLQDQARETAMEQSDVDSEIGRRE